MRKELFIMALKSILELILYLHNLMVILKVMNNLRIFRKLRFYIRARKIVIKGQVKCK